MRSLDDPITMLAGVGEKRAASLASLGIQTIEDLLTYYPSFVSWQCTLPIQN